MGDVKTRCFQLQENGNVVIIFGLSLPLLLGVAGTAIDYGSAAHIRSVEQSIADSTALLVAGAESVTAATDGIKLAEAELKSRLGAQNSNNGFRVTGNWIDGSNYRVTISTTMKTSMVHLLPGMPKSLEISTATTVNRTAPTYTTAPPTLSQLSPEAADYNRVYFYCYSSDISRQKEADLGRRGLTPIADNGTPPTVYDLSKMPTCGKNEAPSYMLRNVRNARTSPGNWNDTGTNTYTYFTDVKIDTGTLVQTMNMKGNNVGNKSTVDMIANPMLETMICDNAKQCTPKSQGGIIPDRKTGRSPAVASGSCEDGKYMYYGWEDRPQTAGGDRDYDDIRLVVSCPKQIKETDKKLRIVE